MTTISIAGRRVGPGHPALIVAELSGNAGQDYAKAEALVRAAAEAGADAVKTQVFTPSALTLDCLSEPFWLSWQGELTTLYRLYERTAMPMHWHEPLMALARSLGMVYFGSVFDHTGIDLMVKLAAPCLKIASFEVTDELLIRAATSTGLPLIVSLGMASEAEVGRLFGTWLVAGGKSLALLKCTSAYPAGVRDANLRTLERWTTEYLPAPPAGYDLAYGLSDHSRSNSVVSAAVALGASVVERHLRLRGDQSTPDWQFSDEPAEFAAMVRVVRETEAALGTVHYGPTESELPMLRLRRSLWVVKDLAAGEVLTPEHVRSLRPADGLAPKHLDEVIGRRAKRALPRGTPLAWSDLEG